MSKNSIRFALQKGQLSSNEENSFAKVFLDNIKAENEENSFVKVFLANIKAENEENSFAKDFLDIDFFNSRKSRILDNIKAENELQKLNETCIHEFKRAMSN